jgi:dihydrodipicolinate synthase/N-acetylneuraminate lyase
VLTYGRQQLEGVIAATVTPFGPDGEVDIGAFEKQVAFLVSSNVHGLLTAGSIGEGPLLSTEEKIALLRAARSASGSRVKICAGCIATTTKIALEEVLESAKLEPDYVVVVAPYYYNYSAASIQAHFEQIAARSPVPVLIYNIPQHTHNPIDLYTMRQLSHVGNIAGVKDTSGDFKYLVRSRCLDFPSRFLWFQGDDLLIESSLIQGCSGMVSGLVGIWPQPFTSMYECRTAQETEGMDFCQKRIAGLLDILNKVEADPVTIVKTALDLLGRSGSRTRVRHGGLSEAQRAVIRAELDRLEMESFPSQLAQTRKGLA